MSPAEGRKPYRARRSWIVVHRYVGLTIGLVVVMLGLTGSAIVYWRELDRMLNPERSVHETGGTQRSLDEILAIVKAAHPQRPKPWTLEPQYDARSPVYAIYRRPEERGLVYGTNLYVAVNPYTGEIISTWYWGETVVTWIYDLHSMLQAGLSGHEVVGAFGVVLLFVSATGLYVWWPLGRFSKRHFAVNTRAGAARLELDLHRAGGFYSLPLMLLFALTGFMMVFPGPLTSVVASMSPLDGPTPTSLHGGDETHGTSAGHQHGANDPRYPQSTPRPGVAPMTIAAAVARAAEMFPGAELKRVYTPAGERGVYGVILRGPTEMFHRTYPLTEVWLDQFDGRLLASSDPRESSVGQKFLDLPLPLHNGEAAGAVGRALVFIAGLVPLLLFVTGFLQWARRTRRRMKNVSLAAIVRE